MTVKLLPEIPPGFLEAAEVGKLFSLSQIEGELEDALAREQLGSKNGKCETNLFFGFFFDGTKNNYLKADLAKNHSNVARLYDCFPGLSVPGVLPKSTNWTHNVDQYKHFFKAYIPGVASPFQQVGDDGEGLDETLGAGTGRGGQARIAWALIQSLNNVHRYFTEDHLLISSEEAASLVHRMDLSKWHRRQMPLNRWSEQPGPNDEQNETTQKVLIDLLRRLHGKVSRHWSVQGCKPEKTAPAIVKTIYMSVFGFSRGATQARAFTNWLIALCKLDAQLCGKSGMTLGGFPVEFDFLGIFDTVASVGVGNSYGNKFWGRYFDGHGAWADAEENLRIPEGVRCLHLVAAHEIRRSFPVDSISVKGSVPETCTEVVVPGVHSDIGCGYCPTEQGRGVDADGADMLSRIPLIYMYREARLAGVPLKLEDASDIVKKRFAVTPDVIESLNSYLSICKAKATKETHPSFTEIMREQTKLRIMYHRARRVSGPQSLERSESFLRATNFDKNDLHSAYQELEDEIAAFEAWLGKTPTVQASRAQMPGFNNELENEWKEIARWWKTEPALPASAVRFFDNYVHDSRAWFKISLSEPDSEEKTIKLLDRWSAQLDGAGPATDANVQGRKAPSRTKLEQDEAARAYKKTGQIPRMRTYEREDWRIAGYLRYRKAYAGADNYHISQAPANRPDAANRA